MSAPTHPPAETSADAPSAPPGTAGFCERCAHAMERRVPDGDNRSRRVCPNCGHVAYENPKNVVGCLLEWEGKVLLCRRGIEPRHGLWTLPAGFMENGETTLEGAAREAYEEATARSDDLRLFAVYDLPRISQVYVMFAGTLLDGFAEANEETLEIRLYEWADIPWDDIAFPVVTDTLRRWHERRDGGTDGGTDGGADGGGGRAARDVLHARIASPPGTPLDIERFG